MKKYIIIKILAERYTLRQVIFILHFYLAGNLWGSELFVAINFFEVV